MFNVVLSLRFGQEVFDNYKKMKFRFRSALFIEFTKAGFLMSCFIFEPPNISALIFSVLNGGIFSLIYAQHDPFFINSLYIRPSFIWRGSEMIFSRSSKGLVMIFPPPNVHVFTLRPLFSIPAMCFVSAIPDAWGARIFDMATLLSKEKVYHL